MREKRFVVKFRRVKVKVGTDVALAATRDFWIIPRRGQGIFHPFFPLLFLLPFPVLNCVLTWEGEKNTAKPRGSVHIGAKMETVKGTDE